MAHTKSQGSVKGNRDSISKRLGVKVSGGQTAFPGNIIIRQRGTRIHPGNGVSMGKDYTIFSLLKGKVTFKQVHGKKFVEVING